MKVFQRSVFVSEMFNRQLLFKEILKTVIINVINSQMNYDYLQLTKD